jgi:REP element-mobilizing transposase RayT
VVVRHVSTKSFNNTTRLFISSHFARIAVKLFWHQTEHIPLSFSLLNVRSNSMSQLAAIIMPDHVHLFVCGDEEFVLSRWITGLKHTLARANGWSRNNGQIWQEGFFDHMLRNDQSMNAKWDYIFENPVRAGLVEDAEGRPYQGEIVVIDRV